MNFDLTKWQAYIAPVAAPAAPMILLGTGLYSDMLKSGTAQGLALVGATISAAATEAVGALVCVMALEAFSRRTWGVMALAIACAIVYAGIVYVGISRLPNGGSFGFTVFVSIIGYIGYGIWGAFQKADASKAANADNQIAILAAQTKYAEQQAAIAKAEARKAKAEHASEQGAIARSVRPNSRTAEQSAEHAQKLEAVRVAVEILKAKGEKITTRSVAELAGMSNSTASGYMAELSGKAAQ